jgi:hypothetical protein
VTNEFAAEQHAAERLAAGLHALGWEVGAGAAIWARVIKDELARHDGARARFETNTADREAWDRLHGSGFVLAVAIAQVLAFETRVRKLTGDAELARARADFDAVAPRAKDVRDVAAHLDEYAIGEGKRQTERRQQHERAMSSATSSRSSTGPPQVRRTSTSAATGSTCTRPLGQRSLWRPWSSACAKSTSFWRGHAPTLRYAAAPASIPRPLL